MNLQIDELLVEQAIINLLKTAAEASRPGHSLEIKIMGQKTSSNRYQLSILDNGVGIPEDKLRQVVVPFFTTKTTGTGIGLPLARQIMELHGGLLQIERRTEQGTRVDLYFPL